MLEQIDQMMLEAEERGEKPVSIRISKANMRKMCSEIRGMLDVTSSPPRVLAPRDPMDSWNMSNPCDCATASGMYQSVVVVVERSQPDDYLALEVEHRKMIHA